MRAGLRADPSRLEVLGLSGLFEGAQHVAIAPMTTHTFDGRAGGEQVVPMGTLTSLSFASGVVAVRLHHGAWGSSTASATVRVLNVSRPPEARPVLFTAASPVAAVALPNGASGPALWLAALAPPIGAELQVELVFSQGANAGRGPSTLTLSVDLVGRPRA